MQILVPFGLVVGMLLTVSSQSANAAKDQSEYAVTSQINLAHTGSVDFAAGFAPPLVKAWTTDLGPNDGPIHQPLVADNRVVVDTGINIFSLDLTTGKQKWKRSLPCCNLTRGLRSRETVLPER